MDAEVVVVGGGIMGLSAAWRIAATGRAVMLLERFRVGHDAGSSHGPTRIFRAVYEHPRYVRMAGESLPLWREAERRSGEVLRISGGIDAGDDDQTQRCADAMQAGGGHFEWLDPAAVRARFPWCRLPGRALYAPGTGVIDAAAAVRTMRERAVEAGAEVLEERPATSIIPDDHGATVETAEGPVRARLVVVAAGAWARELLQPVGLAPPLRITDEQVFYAPGPAETVPLIWRADRFFYTVPAFDGGPTIKLGEHRAGPETHPDARDRRFSTAAAAVVSAWAADALPGIGPLDGSFDSCLYSSTPDEDFVIDKRGPLIVLSPCSGHGFKFAPLVGEIAARLVSGEPPPVASDAFSLSRF